MSDRIFFPVSSSDFKVELKAGQRYRYSFGDLRLSQGIKQLGDRIADRGTLVINQLSEDASEKDRFYKLLNNPNVELSELIDSCCQIKEELVAQKHVLCLLDTTSTSLLSWKKEKRKRAPSPGVVEDNRTPGFFGHSCLVVDEDSKYIIGLGDIVLYDRPKSNQTKKQGVQTRARRAKLPLEQKDSYVWALAGTNTYKRVQQAQQITFVLDQGGDGYEGLQMLSQQGADFIVRSNENRMALHASSGLKAELSAHLEQEKWQDERKVPIRALDHYSKSSGKQVVRQARLASLKIRWTQVYLCLPCTLKDNAPRLEQVLNVLEVLEDPASVPPAEVPIHWRLLTTRSLENPEQAWHIVSCYQMRWFIEQLFRVYKKQGLDIEYSQFKDPDAVKRQAILALKAAVQVLQLTLARSALPSIPLETVFNQPQEKIVL